MSNFAEKYLNVRCQVVRYGFGKNVLKTSIGGEFQITRVGMKRKKW